MRVNPFYCRFGGVFMAIGMQELVIILFIVLLLFGGRKLPELARSMGEAVNEFNRSLRGEGKKK